MTLTQQPGAAGLRAQLVRDLVDLGALTSPRWCDAFENVPRHLFVDQFTVRDADGARRQITAEDPRWLHEVYTDTSLVTQWDATGAATSSSSQPRIMARMLELLDVDDDDTVLEVGTGTGYNSALLCHGLGASKVTSIDVDTALVEDARTRLARLGYRPHLAAGDGLAGYSVHAPYDRILGTCATHRIPTAWLNQTSPGGRIVTPVGGGVVALVVGQDRSAVGRFDRDPAVFMPARPPGITGLSQHDRVDLVFGTGAEVRATDLLDGMFDKTFAFVAAVAVPGLSEMWDRDGGWYAVSHDPSRSWARAESTATGAVVNQDGPRRLWGELERAHDWWVTAGRPAHDSLGLTVTPDYTHTLWVDQPDGHPLSLT